jgi:hypothetical protein
LQPTDGETRNRDTSSYSIPRHAGDRYLSPGV